MTGLLCLAAAVFIWIAGYHLSRPLELPPENDPFECDCTIEEPCDECRDDEFIDSGGVSPASESMDFTLWEMQVKRGEAP